MLYFQDIHATNNQTVRGVCMFNLTTSFHVFVSLPELFLFSSARMSDLRALWVEEGAGS